MKAKFFLFGCWLAGCSPGDPVIADYRGQLLEYGTEEPIEGADVKLLKNVFSGPTGNGSYEAAWTGKTDYQGVFCTQWESDMQVGYFTSDSSFFDLGPAQADWVEPDQALQKFYLMGKNILQVHVQDTGQANGLSFVEILPYSPTDPNIIEVPGYSFPFYSLVFAHYPQHLSYRFHFLDGQNSPFLTTSFLTGARGDTTQVTLFY